jgi:phenylacetic acid degradation operon negative regulatory protein
LERVEVTVVDDTELNVSAAVSSRRRSLGSGSARSLLLTVLGEFVYPRGRAVWTSTLLRALGELGVEEKSARQAISRAAAEGLLSSERAGRRVRWSLTDPGVALLREGTQRIYSFMQEEPEWDGRWLLVSVAVPEAQRQLRHRLRTQLTWLGMGSPVPGLWVVPDAEKEDAVAQVLGELGLRSKAFAWVGHWAPIGDKGALISAAWSLDEIEEEYRTFANTFSLLRTSTATEAFIAQVHLVQAWRRFPFLDPALPSRLLDHDWPGSAASELFRDRHEHWRETAQRRWDEWESESERG